MHKRPLKLLSLGLLNAAAYHFAYVDFLNVVFDYAGFAYEHTSGLYLMWTYLLAALPVLAARKSNEPSTVGCALIYALSYIPIQLTFTFLWPKKTGELMLIQALLAISMSILFRACAPARPENRMPRNETVFFEMNRMTMLVHVLTVLGISLMVVEFGSIIKFVSFEDVYELRADSANIQASTLTNYLVMWLTYCLGPFYMARALVRNYKRDWAAGIVLFILIYSTTGSKLAILTPLFMIGMKLLIWGRDEFLVRFLTAIAIFVGLIVIVIPEEGILRWVNAIFLNRVFGANGWAAAVYYEYFSDHGFTYYNHIGPIKVIFDGYPYGNNSLGQEIAKFYLNSDTANVNAGFWASDAFAALGLAGVPIVTVFLAAFIKQLDSASRRFSLQFLNLWLLGFWMALMNVPLATALLSCGGLMILFLLRFIGPVQRG